MGLTLREVRDEDLPLLFEQWADPVAAHMAAFTAPDHMDRDAFERRWSRLRADETVLTRVVVVDGEVAGTIGSWGEPGEREVTYWIGRSYWGKGIATDALNAFLAVDRSRPLQARVASDNVASRRVLEKCGFRVIATERNVAEARSSEIEELVLRLDELASPGKALICSAFAEPSDGLEPSNPLLTMEVSGRHARTRAITRDTVSPANRCE